MVHQPMIPGCNRGQQFACLLSSYRIATRPNSSRLNQALEEAIALNKGESKHLTVKLRKLDQ